MPPSPDSKRVIVIGAGKVGRLVTRLLAGAGGDYAVTVADRSEDIVRAAAAGPSSSAIATRVVDLGDRSQIRAVLTGHDYVLSCAPFNFNLAIAETAREAGVSYLDLTEDVATTKGVARLATDSALCFIPQCGLAPGFISIVAAELARSFDSLEAVKLRVGALPIYPHNRLKYNLSWSTEGLINEYASPCEAIIGGRFTTTQPLEALESLSVDGIEYEAFNTSGGVGTLAESWLGRIQQLDYKSIRYPGHRDLIAFLMSDLKFRDDRDTLKRVLERSLPYAHQDVVLIFVTVSGMREGRYSQRTYVKKIYHGEMAGEAASTIQITTASSLCAVLDLHVAGVLPRSGFVRQETVPFAAFLENRFGRIFA